jgi:hypothetical protein
VHTHDFWHWFKNFRKKYEIFFILFFSFTLNRTEMILFGRLNDQAPTGIPKGSWELISGTTETLIKTAKLSQPSFFENENENENSIGNVKVIPKNSMIFVKLSRV